MQKQAELTQLQQAFLPDKGALPFLSPERVGMCQLEKLYRNINSNITPEIFNTSYSLIHINENNIAFLIFNALKKWASLAPAEEKPSEIALLLQGLLLYYTCFAFS